MIITAEVIRSYNPCASGITTFERKYPGFRGNLCELLSLEDISYSDKVWLACRVCPTMLLVQWSVECAESQLHLFESQFPGDNRVRDSLSTVKNIITRKIHTGDTVRAAAGAAKAAWAAWAARAAARAAVRAAWAARAAVRAGAAWDAWAARAAWDAAAVRAAEKTQEDINLSILIALCENESL